MRLRCDGQNRRSLNIIQRARWRCNNKMIQCWPKRGWPAASSYLKCDSHTTREWHSLSLVFFFFSFTHFYATSVYQHSYTRKKYHRRTDLRHQHYAPSGPALFVNFVWARRVKSCAVTADKYDILQRELNLNGRTLVRVPPLIAAIPSKEIALSEIALPTSKSEQKFLYLVSVRTPCKRYLNTRSSFATISIIPSADL